ncbi:MAG TPA: hypothetical protein PKZ76_08325 [Xanthomonadaceae bacterium]|nr:hypothetical protein [Xanthomonadaceae bacterium]
MNLGPILDAALAAQAVCVSLELPYCVIGGVALQRWGEPRYTADQVRTELEPLLAAKEAPELATELEARIARHVTKGP